MGSFWLADLAFYCEEALKQISEPIPACTGSNAPHYFPALYQQIERIILSCVFVY